MSVKVLIAEFKPSMYSTRYKPSYQVQVSYPLPTPSTVIGSIGRALAYMGKCSGTFCIDDARKLVKKARAYVSPDVVILKSSIVLTRLRGAVEERRLPLSQDEIPKFRDAMLREYVYVSDTIKVLIIPRTEDQVDVVEQALYLIDRLGDSESLVALKSVKVVNARPSSSRKVNVIVKADKVKLGNCLIMKGVDEQGNGVDLAFPITRDPSKVEELYTPSWIEVDEQTYEIEDVRFPVGDEW